MCTTDTRFLVSKETRKRHCSTSVRSHQSVRRCPVEVTAESFLQPEEGHVITLCISPLTQVRGSKRTQNSTEIRNLEATSQKVAVVSNSVPYAEGPEKVQSPRSLDADVCNGQDTDLEENVPVLVVQCQRAMSGSAYHSRRRIAEQTWVLSLLRLPSLPSPYPFMKPSFQLYSLPMSNSFSNPHELFKFVYSCESSLKTTFPPAGAPASSFPPASFLLDFLLPAERWLFPDWLPPLLPFLPSFLPSLGALPTLGALPPPVDAYPRVQDSAVSCFANSSCNTDH